MRFSQLARHPLTIAILNCSAIIAAVLIATPFLIDMGIERWMMSRGDGEVQIEDVDFNPFTGRVSMNNLVVETESDRLLHIPHAVFKFSWKQLFTKHIHFKEMTVRDTFLVVDKFEEVGFRVGGFILQELVGAFDEDSTPDWGVGIDRFELVNSRVEYQTPEITATYFIDRHTLTGLESWNETNTVFFELVGRINESPIQIKTKFIPFAAERKWDGTLLLQNGSLALFSKALAPELPMAGSIDIDAKVKASMLPDGTLHIATDGNIGIEQLAMEYDRNDISQAELNWQGKLAGKKMPRQGMTVNLDGRLLGKKLGVVMPSQGLQVELVGFDLQGEAEFKQQDDTMDVALTAELTGEYTSITDKDRNLILLEADSFIANGIHSADRNDISFANITIQQPLLVAGRQKDTGDGNKLPSLLQATAIEIRDTTLHDLQNLSISDLHLRDSQFFIARRKNGSWYLIDELTSKPAVGEQKPESDRQEVSGIAKQLFLQNFRITGNSSVRFEDESPFPPYHTTFLINEFLATDIDSANTDKPVVLRLDGMIGRYGTATFDGEVYLFDKPLSLAITGKVNALDLPPLSSYTRPMIGYILTSGQMDAELKLDVDKGEMLGVNDLLLRNLEVKPQDPAEMDELGKQMDIPLESGLAMLRNKKDEVKLKIKLQGNINSPEFDIQDVINQALAKALQFGAVNYLKYALQPFGTYIAIAEVAGKAGKEIIKVRLDPVIFAAGEQEFDETAAQYIEKISGILNDRPNMRVEICGKAVEADRIALLEKRIEFQKKIDEIKKELPKKEDTGQEEKIEVAIPDAVLLKVAMDRAHLVKETLFGQYGVDHSRMYLCLPEIIAAPESRPSVDLLID